MQNLRISLTLIFSFLILLLNAQNPYQFNKEIEIKCTDVKSQDQTGTCWSFSTASFLESEILKTSGKVVDLSEIFVARHIYIEKANLYIRFQGKTNFSQGALAHDLIKVAKTAGLVPESVYNGKNGKTAHNHNLLEKQLKQYLDSILKISPIPLDWASAFVKILDNHLGMFPPVFEYEGKIYNPITFAESLGLKFDDYIGITSFTHHPYYEKFAVEVPDNFSRGYYYNVPLDMMIDIMNKSLTNGHSIEWDGDVSEPGFGRNGGIAILLNKGQKIEDKIIVEPDVNEKLRQEKFDNQETTDDHLMHIVGMAKDQAQTTYYITKNSWGSQSGNQGYVYMSLPYVKLKTVTIYINKNILSTEQQKQLGL